MYATKYRHKNILLEHTICDSDTHTVVRLQRTCTEENHVLAATSLEMFAGDSIIRVSHFSALAEKYSAILGCIINRIRLGGLMCNLGNFLQLNMYQELPLFAFVYMCLGAGKVSLNFVTVTLELSP
jgi:hypothetical protein